MKQILVVTEQKRVRGKVSYSISEIDQEGRKFIGDLDTEKYINGCVYNAPSMINKTVKDFLKSKNVPHEDINIIHVDSQDLVYISDITKWTS